MPVSPTAEPEPDFVCECEEDMRSACAGEPFYKEHEGKRYCVLHFPYKERNRDFEKALQRKLDDEDFDFRGVRFSEASFAGFDFSSKADFKWATFDGAAYFIGATFNAEADFGHATFNAEADFGHATFNAQADFRLATFNGDADFAHATFNRGATAQFSRASFSAVANFESATFSAQVYFGRATFSATADFSSTTFSAESFFGDTTFSAVANFESATFSAATYFARATFGDANFGWATFSESVRFALVTFRDYVRFTGTKSRQAFSDGASLDLQFARIEKPDHVSFHTLILRPHWFINVDARKFDFTNIEWRFGFKQEILDFTAEAYELVGSAHRLLAIACRNLAVNAEENHRYEDASKFRYLAMEARRRESFAGFVPWRLSWWYWLASGYGERVLKAFLVLLSIWFIAALLYTRVGFARWEPRLASESDAATAHRDVTGIPLRFSRALTYSAGVMTFQRPEPQPATTAAQTTVLLETILGPVQAALLALAIRRKFMR